MAAELMYIAAIQSIDPRSLGNTVFSHHTMVLHWMQQYESMLQKSGTLPHYGYEQIKH